MKIRAKKTFQGVVQDYILFQTNLHSLNALLCKKQIVVLFQKSLAFSRIIQLVISNLYRYPRLKAWTTLEEDYSLTWGPGLKPVLVYVF
jgi:hypothetical protein